MAMAGMTRVVAMAFMAFVVILMILVIIMRFRMISMLVVILVAFVITMFFRMVFMLVVIVVVAMIVRMFLMLLVIIVAFVFITAVVSIVIAGLHVNTAIEMFRFSPDKRRPERRFNGETPLIGKPPLQDHTELSIDGVMLRVPLQIVLKTSMPLDRHHRNGTKLSGRQRLFATSGTMSTNLMES